MEIECSLNMYEPNTQRVSNTTTLTICIFITQRYQLKIQPSQDVKIVLEDAISPRLCFHLKVPLSVVTAGLPHLRQNYVLKELYKINFDPTVSLYLKERIESWVLGELEKNGCKFNEGCEVVAELKVFKAESVGKEEFDRISCQILGPEGLNLLHWDPSYLWFIAGFVQNHDDFNVMNNLCLQGVIVISVAVSVLYMSMGFISFTAYFVFCRTDLCSPVFLLKGLLCVCTCIFFLFHFCFYF